MKKFIACLLFTASQPALAQVTSNQQYAPSGLYILSEFKGRQRVQYTNGPIYFCFGPETLASETFCFQQKIFKSRIRFRQGQVFVDRKLLANLKNEIYSFNRGTDGKGKLIALKMKNESVLKVQLRKGTEPNWDYLTDLYQYWGQTGIMNIITKIRFSIFLEGEYLHTQVEDADQGYYQFY